MRIIAGRNRGRHLKGPGRSELFLRPTSDRARESLFNIIGPRIRGACFLDLFAGTGAVGLEAESRGAAEVVLVERNPVALDLIRDNIILCRAEERCHLLKYDLSRPLSRLDAGRFSPFDLIFFDPPYESGLYEAILSDLVASCLVNEGGLVIAEGRKGSILPECCPGLVISDRRQYGENNFWFYRMGS